MTQIHRSQIAKAVLGYLVVVVAVVGLRSSEVRGVAIRAGLRPSPALRCYQNRIRATQTLLETGRLELDGS